MGNIWGYLTQGEICQVCDDGGGEEYGVKVGELLVPVLRHTHLERRKGR